MKIHKARLQHVRHIKDVTLDLSAPLTLIMGPHGVCKSSTQTAIMCGLFHGPKEMRDGLISRFDPHSPPTVTLELSRGYSATTITLTRRLTDDTGEWREGATSIKQKGKALEKVQEELPISAAAAASLLWAQQEDMDCLVDGFPSDGHTLLTATTIKGAGPDPKKVVQQLEGDFKDAKRSGKYPGPLVQAEVAVNTLESEFNAAMDAQKSLAGLLADFEIAKTAVSRAQEQHGAAEKELDTLVKIERALQAVLQASERLTGLEIQETEWNGLEQEINQARRTLQDLTDELAGLQSQHRVARDREFADRISTLEEQLRLVRQAEQHCTEIETKLKIRTRPDKADVQEFRRLHARAKEATDKMDATGLRYELGVEAGTRMVSVSEDNAPTKQIELSADQPHEGIVGTVVITSDGLRVSASGKEDVAGHKRIIHQMDRDIQTIWKRFDVCNEESFVTLAAEKEQLESDLKEGRNELVRRLKGTTLVDLQTGLSRQERLLQDNAVTPEDEENCRGRHLVAASEIEKKIVRKESEAETADRHVKSLERKRPTDEQRGQLTEDLKKARKQARDATSVFEEVDKSGQQPTENLLARTRETLEEQRETLKSLTTTRSKAENDVTRLSTELKHAGPERPLSSIESDLEEARNVLHREHILQSARELLKQSVEDKIKEMAAEVPRELGERVSQHLARLTGGVFKDARLGEDLTLASVTEGGASPERWEPHELSHGERHQAALAIRVAVARALSDLSGSMFLILDDSLVNFDPKRRAETEALLLDLATDGRLQVILFTCHTDWAADWKQRAGDRISLIELDKTATYYRPPAAVACA